MYIIVCVYIYMCTSPLSKFPAQTITNPRTHRSLSCMIMQNATLRHAEAMWRIAHQSPGRHRDSLDILDHHSMGKKHVIIVLKDIKGTIHVYKHHSFKHI